MTWLISVRVGSTGGVSVVTITFSEAVSLHLNGEEVRGFHVANAHTDGDTIVHFTKSNIVHMGDVFFNLMYPFIDLESGGSVNGVVAAVDRVLGMIDGKTKVIPGHGPVTDREGLKAYRDMLAGVRDRVLAGVNAGKSLKDVIASKPTDGFEEVWGKGFLKAEKFVESLYQDVSASKKAK